MGEADDADEDDGDERDQARHLSARCPQGCQGFPNQGRPLSERRRSDGPRVVWPQLHIRKCEDMSAWPLVLRCQCLRALAELGSYGSGTKGQQIVSQRDVVARVPASPFRGVGGAWVV